MPVSGCECGGLILAGGRGTRMGGVDKGRLELGGRTLLERAVERAGRQVGPLLLSYNGAPAELAALGCPVLPDTVPGFAGPLAGILAGLRHLQARHPRLPGLVSFACDTPWFPDDLAPRLEEARRRCGAEIAVAASGERLHPVFAWWPVTLADRIEDSLRARDERRLGAFIRAQRHAVVHWVVRARDPFFNINTPGELAQARALDD